MTQSVGLYIHVPFCIKRCTYCSFYSTTQGEEERRAFVNSLCREMAIRACETTVSTLYFGGGTPSQLSESELEQIMEALHTHYRIDPQAEITFETNPDDLTLQRAFHLAEMGINRVSLGVQSFDDNMLKQLHRRHNAQQACDAIESLQQAGISNLSVDLIYGLPEQTPEYWNYDLSTALSLPIQHLSAYALSYEPGTVLYQQLKKGTIQEVDEENSLRMFRTLIEKCEEQGLEQYEISNFARSGFESRHNSSYWKGVPYIGLGPSAHSFDGKQSRRHNLDRLAGYLATPAGEDVPHEIERLTLSAQKNEHIMTRLRTRRGISLPAFAGAFGERALQILLREARPHVKKGWLLHSNETLALSREGLFVADYVMADLMSDESD